MRARLAILLAGAVALGGCAYGYGGYGSPYSGLSVGVGYGSGYGGYGGYDSYYGGYPYSGYGGYGYGAPYYGWYDNYYYPGSGYYVYDSYRRPHVWSDSQRRYWSSRRDRALDTTRNHRSTTRDRSSTTTSKQTVLRENWSGFERRDGDTRKVRTDRRERRSDDSRPR
ncbi:hypothetical protein [Sphingomonas anseongensis]|jgi:hypothetical protein|uniref:hypothetical protein n=1 Tax=Sphingomonas anseongensis TaxID=2908207 RepID=UPI003D68933D